jgi:hypothetical protein
VCVESTLIKRISPKRHLPHCTQKLFEETSRERERERKEAKQKGEKEKKKKRKKKEREEKKNGWW